jgi:CoA:oxalate CoA-transferase
VQALSGLMSVTGQPDGPPTKCGTSVGDITGGLFTVIGIASALYHRARTGSGLKVDVSMLDGQMSILESAVMRYAVTGESPRAMGNRHPSITPFEPYQAADKLFIIAVGNDALYVKLCHALGRPELALDQRFHTNPDRTAHAEELKQLLEQTFKTAPAAHWLTLLEKAQVPCAPIQTVAEAVEHPQTRARNMIVDAGGLSMPGNPVKFDVFADLPTRRPAPDLDADGDRIKAEFA